MPVKGYRSLSTGNGRQAAEWGAISTGQYSERERQVFPTKSKYLNKGAVSKWTTAHVFSVQRTFYGMEKI